METQQHSRASDPIITELLVLVQELDKRFTQYQKEHDERYHKLVEIENKLKKIHELQQQRRKCWWQRLFS